MTMFGVITAVLGLAALAAPAITGLSVVLSVGVLVILGGTLKMIWAFSADSFGRGLLAFAIGGLTFGAFRLRRESGRIWMLLGGIASIVLGAMIWAQFPLSGGWAIGVLLGIKLLFVSIAMLTAGSAVRTLAKDMAGAAVLKPA
jgi:uncharacterized membrane protein HdeD (DUF308 family)